MGSIVSNDDLGSIAYLKQEQYVCSVCCISQYGMSLLNQG